MAYGERKYSPRGSLCTYYKPRVDGVQSSIIDYAFADRETLSSITKFEVMDGVINIPSSDHVPLLLHLETDGEPDVTTGKEEPEISYTTNWTAFKKKVEEKVTAEGEAFDGLTVEEQAMFLTDVMTKSFLHTSTIKRQKNKKKRITKRLPKVVRDLVLLRKQKLNALRKKINENHPHLEELESYEQAKSQELLERLQYMSNRKFKLRQLLRPGVKNASTLFWRTVKGKQAARPRLPIVQLAPGMISSVLQDRQDALNSHLKAKFKTSYEPVGDEEIQVDPDIFTSSRRFSDELSDEIDQPIKEEELIWAISQLQEGKAAGTDKITTKMVLNAPTNWKTKLLALFRNVQLSGTVPANWKDGKIVMLLKRTPATLMANYRPITLISVISKLFTKIIARRLSDAIVKEDVLGPEQNGFRPGRGCGDNLFVLNTLVEKFEDTRTLNLCFIDIKAAYDSVDRTILWKRLERLNVPHALIVLMKDYYKNDSIQCTMGDVRSRKHYQTRGLRQVGFYW